MVDESLTHIVLGKLVDATLTFGSQFLVEFAIKTLQFLEVPWPRRSSLWRLTRSSAISRSMSAVREARSDVQLPEAMACASANVAAMSLFST